VSLNICRSKHAINLMCATALSIAILSGCSSAGTRSFLRFKTRPSLAEAQRHCYYKGKPLNPLLFQAMIGSLGDSHSGLDTIDLAAIPAPSEGWEAIASEGNRVIWQKGDGLDYERFEYQHLGTFANGAAVMLTTESGAGSGVFKSLLFVKFEISPGGRAGEPTSLLMRKVGYRPLGDRDRRQIQTTKDRVIISPCDEKAGMTIYASDLR
jgi:hypothetical protein